MSLTSHPHDEADLELRAPEGPLTRLMRGWNLMAQTRPSPARGLILGLLLSALLWAALVGFVTTF